MRALDFFQETWEAKERSTESVISEMLAMREKSMKTRKLVQQNLRQNQAK